MPETNTQALFSIGAVSTETGVNAVTLRAWERRYGLIQPKRTPKGHRLYTQGDIDLIHNILYNLDRGLSISKVADRIRYANETRSGKMDEDPWIAYRQRFTDAIADFDELLLNTTYNEIMSLYPVDVVTRKLIEPLLSELGTRWEQDHLVEGRTPVAEEHFFSVFVRNKLGARFHHRNIQNHGPRLLLACLPGEHHEFGQLLFALAAHERGYRLVMLGADMPLRELPAVIQKTRSSALVLSASGNLSCIGLCQPLQVLAEASSVPIFIGGDISVNCSRAFNALNVELIGNDLTDGILQIAQNTGVNRSQNKSK